MMAEANPLLSGVVEIDEMYAGAPPRKRARSSRDDDGNPPNPTGRGTKRPLVLVAAQRGGDVVAKVIPTHGKEAIASALEGIVDLRATVMTDGLPAYKHIGKSQPHLSVNHSDRGIRPHRRRHRPPGPCEPHRELQRLHASRGDRRVPRDLGQAPRALRG